MTDSRPDPVPAVASPSGTVGAPAPARARGRRVALVAGVMGVGLALALAGWLRRAPAVHYLTAVVSRGDVVRQVTASGTVNPVTTIQVGTYVSGAIQSISCDFNTRVKAGQLCAKIDPRPYQTVLDEESAALATARAQLRKDEANLTFAKVIYERDVDLLARQIVSQETVDTALSAYNQATAQVELDKSSIQQHEAAERAAKVNLDYTNIVSPVQGTVVSRNVTQGQTVAASFQTPTLFLIATDLTQMQVDTNVSESDVGNVAVGDAVSFGVEAYPERVFTGTVVQVRQAPQSVQNVITYDAVVGVRNADLKLMPGMTAAVRILTAQRSGVLRVPNQALHYTPGQAGKPSREGAAPAGKGVLWRLREGKPERLLVETGLQDETYTEVRGGTLAPGDAVVIGEAQDGAARVNAPRL